MEHPESISDLRQQFLKRPAWTTILLFLVSTVLTSFLAALLLSAVMQGPSAGSIGQLFLSIVLFFWGGGNLDPLRDSAIGSWVLAVLALARIVIPALLVSVLFHRLMHPPRATTLASKLFLWKRNVHDDSDHEVDQPVLTVRIYNRLPMPLSNVELRAFLRRSKTEPYEVSESGERTKTVIKTKKLVFQDYDIRGAKPKLKSTSEIKRLSLLYPSSPFSVYLPLDSNDVEDELELKSIQGAEIDDCNSVFLLVSISGTISESGSTFLETTEFNLSGEGSQIARGKFFELPPKRRKTPSRPSKAIEAVLWDNWKYFEMTQAEAEAALARQPWYQRLRNS